jgi:signal transduction histidine kinase
MDTYFAPAKRANENDLAAEIEIVSKNPVVEGLLHSISGLLAVIDEHRQIVALNDSLLKMLGIEDPAEALGLRHGEALHCIHSQDEPAGCGTTEWCSTCGAAIAIVTSLKQDLPVEKICALSAKRGENIVDIAFRVKSHPIKISNKNFLLLFLQDITLEEQRAALERTFFHDVNNMLNVLIQASGLLLEDNPSELSETVYNASLRLIREVAIQRCLFEAQGCSYKPNWHEIRLKQILRELRSFFANHQAARNKIIKFPEKYPKLRVKTDLSAFLRVLFNMITNALEATDENGIVKIWIEFDSNYLTFNVWNDREIPKEISERVFQRNFSTKEQDGRGIGAFSMKLFGEDILGGQVTFTSSKDAGTIFKFAHPI